MTQETEQLLSTARRLTRVDGDMTIHQLRVLLEVACGYGETTAKQISTKMNVNQGTVSRAVDLWSGYGTGDKPGRKLIDRVEDPDDRRHKLLRLNKRGEKFLAELCSGGADP